MLKNIINIVLSTISNILNINANYNKIKSKYNNLFSNARIIEEWLNKNSLMRHEYKNQLAVLYSISNELTVKEEIKEIIDKKLNANNQIVYDLYNIPNGGLKGLIYHKTMNAREENINVVIESNLLSNNILIKLNSKQIKDLFIIISFLYDKAIKEAKKSRKKQIIIEIYEVNNKTSIIISNTYKKLNKIKPDKKELNFINKIIKNNHLIEKSEEVIDTYQVRTISIRHQVHSKRDYYNAKK